MTSATHSASNGSLALLNDFARECNEGARRGDGEVLLTTWPSHCSALGNCEPTGDVVGVVGVCWCDVGVVIVGDGIVAAAYSVRYGSTWAVGIWAAVILVSGNDTGGMAVTVGIGNTDITVLLVPEYMVGLYEPVGIVALGLVNADDPIFVFWLMLMALLKFMSSWSSVRVSSDSPWLSSWHSWATVSTGLYGDTSGMGDTLRGGWPFFIGSKYAFCRSALDGRSFIRSDICRLNGDWVLTARKLPWRSRRSSMDGVAWGRSIANGLCGFGCGVTRADGGPSALRSLLLRRSVIVCVRNEPLRVNVEFFMSKVMVTPHSVSRRCFRSKHTANAHPTAWDRRSPESLLARKPWHIQRRVVPSRQI